MQVFMVVEKYPLKQLSIITERHKTAAEHSNHPQIEDVRPWNSGGNRERLLASKALMMSASCVVNIDDKSRLVRSWI